jgi:hypothetical protein
VIVEPVVGRAKFGLLSARAEVIRLDEWAEVTHGRALRV